tara:strand:+ start:4858 stop:5316 length:459 start_codon:yes stop_codon:yes gene_type:complete
MAKYGQKTRKTSVREGVRIVADPDAYEKKQAAKLKKARANAKAKSKRTRATGAKVAAGVGAAAAGAGLIYTAYKHHQDQHATSTGGLVPPAVDMRVNDFKENRASKTGAVRVNIPTNPAPYHPRLSYARPRNVRMATSYKKVDTRPFNERNF